MGYEDVDVSAVLVVRYVMRIIIFKKMEMVECSTDTQRHPKRRQHIDISYNLKKKEHSHTCRCWTLDTHLFGGVSVLDTSLFRGIGVLDVLWLTA